MRGQLLASAAALALIGFAAPAAAQSETASTAAPAEDTQARQQAETQPVEQIAPTASEQSGGDIIVTATRRSERLQDVPLAITAFQQETMSEKGLVGYEDLARETPGIVVNKPTANFNNFTARGIATNGYGANLAGTVAIYIDELPISANGNSTILDPTLFDVERVEFLRGPQGTLFGANSLAGAMRIITKAPNLNRTEGAVLVDLGLTDGDSVRQRYNGMINVPLVNDKLAFRAVGFARHEEGWVDNIGTGEKNANTLRSYGGRASLLFQPQDGLSVRLTAMHENNKPKDSGLINPALGDYVRRSDRPDQFYAKLTSYNATANADLGIGDLVSSSTYATFDQYFVVDLAGTFAQAIPFGLDALAYDEIFVQETRLASKKSDSPFDWVIGGFYYWKRRDVDYNYRASTNFLTARNLTGLPDEYYQRFGAYANQSELAAFGEATYRFSPQFWVTGGLRYTSTKVQSFTEPGGFNSNYLTLALTGARNTPLTIIPIPAATGLKVKDNKASYKVSASFKPNRNLTMYATVATGFRSPVVNARAGAVSVVNPNDIVIPQGASSDDLINYEVGVKGSFLDGKLSAALAAYYIKWSNIQVQANRLSDQVQFATNIGEATSKGLEFEFAARPGNGLGIFLNGSLNDAKVTDLTASEAAISGAVDGFRLAGPRFQGSATVRYDFPVTTTINGFASATASHVGKFPGLFPNVPGRPTLINPTFDYTQAFTTVNAVGGIEAGAAKISAYVENLFNSKKITYVHPEAFFDSRYARLRPRTIGIRFGYDF